MRSPGLAPTPQPFCYWLWSIGAALPLHPPPLLKTPEYPQGSQLVRCPPVTFLLRSQAEVSIAGPWHCWLLVGQAPRRWLALSKTLNSPCLYPSTASDGALKMRENNRLGLTDSTRVFRFPRTTILSLSSWYHLVWYGDFHWEVALHIWWFRCGTKAEQNLCHGGNLWHCRCSYLSIVCEAVSFNGNLCL